MTTLQKTIIGAALVAAVGTGVYGAHQAAQLREKNQTLQQQQSSLTDRIRRLQRERDDATNRLAGLLAESAQLQSNSNEAELLKLRGEVGVLRQQAGEANRRADAAEQKLTNAMSAKAQFTSHQTAIVNAAKQAGLAMYEWTGDHSNQFPTNLIQITNELGGSLTIGGIDIRGAFEFLNVGVNVGTLQNLAHPNMIVLRERLARQAPDGTCRRIYLFADGSVQTATSYDGNFDVWEKANTYSPPPNQKPRGNEKPAP